MFGGNLYLKSLIQLISASLNERNVHYMTFGNTINIKIQKKKFLLESLDHRAVEKVYFFLNFSYFYKIYHGKY